MENFIAHSKNEFGNPQLLVDHLRSVALHTKNMIFHTALVDVVWTAGILHDLGKLSNEFQEKLISGSDNKVDHKGLGFGFGRKYGSIILQYVIAGHHGGLADSEAIDNWWREILAQEKLAGLVPLADQFLNELNLKEWNISEHESKLPFSKDIAIRIVFSALVDADFLDTEQHFQPSRTQERKTTKIDRSFLDRFTAYYEAMCKDKSGVLSQIRTDIYRACVDKAVLGPGFFRLTVPTGGGKTLTSLGFALHHALQHNLERIIYAIPFTSIIEQTAGIFKDIFPGEDVLEHHSAVHTVENQEYISSDTWSRLASENWDAPIIITTTVQLFESVFGRSTSVCRKVHNIQNSIIILDEVQTLPLHLLPVIMDLLLELVAHLRVSVLFCTATQPALDEFLKDQKMDPVELAPDPARLFSILKRVEYINETKTTWSWKTVAEKLLEYERAMAVVNTKRDARSLWEACSDENNFHLSSLMCGKHRRDILEGIRTKLTHRETCRLITTQVVEAGVDLDFDCVLRAVGPLDRIVQAAGRCNREGLREQGKVIIFDPEEGSFPRGIYGSAMHKSAQLLNDPNINLDFNDPSTFPDYFSRIRRDITEDPDHIALSRRKLKFERVARDFRMIDDNTTAVVVEYAPDIHTISALISKLKTAPQKARQVMRALQPYMVNIPTWEFDKFSSLTREVFPGVYLWSGKYDRQLGLLKEIDLTRFVQ